MKNMITLLSVVLVVIAASCGLSQAKNINAEELKKMMTENTGLLIIDTRSNYEYNLGHIPKAVNISQEKFYMLDTLLPKEKETPMVFYCRGTG